MPPPHLDPALWRGRRVLLTGHTGFKGSWAALWLHRLGADVTGLALEAEPLSLYRLLRLDEVIDSKVVDLRDAAAVAAVVAAARPQLVLHMAAQALVRRSLNDPSESFAVNVLGTVHLLDALRASIELAAVLVVTSDKVYADVGAARGHREADRLGGEDPYSASKAACEIAVNTMAQCFLRPRGVRVATARGGNVVGGGDFADWRLVPDVVRAARANQTLTLRHPEATRPWQHVLDCVSGYLAYLTALAHGDVVPPSLNFGPRLRHGATVGAFATAIQQALGVTSGWVHEPDPQSHERQTLAIDSHLARKSLDWTDRLYGRRMIDVTSAWYRAWAAGEDMRAVTLRQISDYEASA